MTTDAAPRPTCKTCVYFYMDSAVRLTANAVYPSGRVIPLGECRLQPPGSSGFGSVGPHDWCGSHPEFRGWWLGLQIRQSP
jgi:hypothetical protein